MSDQDLRPPQQRSAAGNSTVRWLWVVLAIAALGYGAWLAREHWAEQQRARTLPPALQPDWTPSLPAAEPVPAPDATQPAQALPTAQAPLHPLPTAAVAASDAPAADLDDQVREWLGAQALKFLVTPGLAHHVAATVDNLPRSQAAVRLWPVSPVGGQMLLQGEGGASMAIAAANSERYDALVGFLTATPPAQVAQWYQQAYPQLQQAYEALGYPEQYFNDRVVAVIDHLLQTPQPQEPLAVRWVQVQGGVPAQQPWLRYEYVNPQWQALSAGQRILLRVGSAHRARLLDYLRALRTHIAR